MCTPRAHTCIPNIHAAYVRTSLLVPPTMDCRVCRFRLLSTTSALIAMVSTVSIVAGVLQDPPTPSLPSQWMQKFREGNMLVASGADFPNSDLTATIGNGFVGGDVGCSGGSGGSAGALHIAGVYSGWSAPHYSVTRATLPNPLSLTPVTPTNVNVNVNVNANVNSDVDVTATQNQPTDRRRDGKNVTTRTPIIPTFIGAAMDLSEPCYLQRWVAPSECGVRAQIETRFYAHRKFRNLVVLELNLVDADHACQVHVSSCTARAGGVIARGPNLFEVESPEQPADPTFARRQPSSVALVADAIPTTLSLTPTNASVVFMAVVMSTLEPGVTNATAVGLATTALATFKQQTSESLFASHAAAWAEVYGLSTTANPFGGGIEVEGNYSFATNINASLYYMLSSVRSDWSYGISEGGLGSQAYNGHIFWSDGVMDGPLFAAINYPIADSLMQYRLARLDAAKAIAHMNGYDGAYWPWQSVVTGFESSCGNSSIVSPPSGGTAGTCYWMHEVHVGADVALYFRLNYRRSQNKTFLINNAWPIVSATADFFASRVNQSTHESKNWTLLNVIGPDEHSYIQSSNTYSNYVAGETMKFAAYIAETTGVAAPNLQDWKTKSQSMYIPIQQFCDIYPWPNASVDGCPDGSKVMIHPQYDGYHGQDINQADVVLMQWPFHADFDVKVAAADRAYYAKRTSGSDTKGFYTGDSSYAIANLFNNERVGAEQQLLLAFRHMLGPFNVWTELDPNVAHSTGHLNFLTGAGGFLENLVFGYGGVRYGEDGCLHLSPSLPPLGVTSLVIRGLAFGDGTIRLEVSASHVSLSRNGGSSLMVFPPNSTEATQMLTAPRSTVVSPFSPGETIKICLNAA
eukprot:m.168666 g.168666  ORF g.168666 m.168666 type:complete len:859 (-) comp31531_c1_seq2:146-2722(-)